MLEIAARRHDEVHQKKTAQPTKKARQVIKNKYNFNISLFP